MPSSFTPQQIEEFLQEFFDVVGARQYIGARYVPIFGRAGEDTVEWDDLAPYEPLTVVMHQGVSYVSRRYVPTGIQITDTAYWVETYRYNAQVEQYRQEVLSFQGQIDQIREDLEADYIPFPDTQQYAKYGTFGQLLSTHANGHTEWVDPVTITPEVAGPIISDWLDDHPEATTTVQDNSITDAKLSQSGGILSRVGVRGTLPRPADFNDYTGNGAWLVLAQQNANPYTNKPINVVSGGLLLVYVLSATNIMQLYFDNGANTSGSAIVCTRNVSYSSATETYSYGTWSVNDLIDAVDSSFTDFDAATTSRIFWVSRTVFNAAENKPPYADQAVGYDGTNNYCCITVKRSNTGLILQHVYIPKTNTIYQRARINSQWQDWKLESIPSIALPNTTDVDTLMEPSTYVIFNTTEGRYPNVPDDLRPNPALLECFRSNDNTNFMIQRITSLTNGRVWQRIGSNGTWNSWIYPLASMSEDLRQAQDDIAELQDEAVVRDNLLTLNLPAIFHTIGVVGDSLASGQGRIDDMAHYHDFYDFSWPQCLAKDLGNTVYNFTKSGLSTRTWLTDSMGWALANDGNHRSDCYIIGLGANDTALGSTYVGSPSDINVQDYTQNADTYYGNYARIISMLRMVEPRSYIFVLTNPVYGSSAEIRAALNNAVRYMPTIFSRVYLIDFDVDEFTGQSFIHQNLVAGHYTPAAYKYMANLINNEMAKVIYNDPEEFYWANLVGTQYADPS